MKNKVMTNKIILFPDINDVFSDTTLACYFKPLLTVEHNTGKKNYHIHLLSADGVFCEQAFLNAESGFFGFQYNNGKYQFLGDTKVFGDSNFHDVYTALQADFDANKDNYLESKITYKAYAQQIKPLLEKVAQFTPEQDPTYYAEAFYCYAFTKYHYQKTNRFIHINAVTENWGIDDSDIFISRDDMNNILNEFFINLEYTHKNNYNITIDNAICATLAYRFALFAGTSIAFLDEESDQIFILEYHS